MDITVTIPDDQADSVKEAFAAQGYENSDAGVTEALRVVVARVAAARAQGLAAQSAATEAQAAVASSFGLDVSLLNPQGPGGPGGRRGI